MHDALKAEVQVKADRFSEVQSILSEQLVEQRADLRAIRELIQLIEVRLDQTTSPQRYLSHLILAHPGHTLLHLRAQARAYHRAGERKFRSTCSTSSHDYRLDRINQTRPVPSVNRWKC